MGLLLTDKDKYYIKKLRALDLFTEITIGKSEIGDGVVVVPCGDGDQFDDLYNHIASVCSVVIKKNRIHPVALNGGAVLMSSQLESKRQGGDIMLADIIEASELKKMEDVFLYTHAPCGIARKNKLDIIDQGRYLLMAKDRLKQTAPNLRVRCFFHVDMHDEVEGNSHKQRTYFVPRARWQDEALLSIFHDLKQTM